MKHPKIILTMLSVLLFGAMPAASAQEIVLKASHQWPGGKGDVRDEMVQIVKREVEKSGTGLKIQVYPGKSLFKPREQWGAMTKGQLDISAFPLAYAAGRHPEFDSTLMPGLVKNHDHAKRLNDSDFMNDIKDIINDVFNVVHKIRIIQTLGVVVVLYQPGHESRIKFGMASRGISERKGGNIQLAFRHGSPLFPRLEQRFARIHLDL